MSNSRYTTEEFWNCLEPEEEPAFELVENLPWADHWHEECKRFDKWIPFEGWGKKFPGRFSYNVDENFPSINAYFQGKPNTTRPEIMKLEPGAIIPPHAHIKPSHYHADEYLYNMAINYPEGCRFAFIKGGEVPYKAGDVYKLFVNYDHCVVNDTTEDRYHLVWKDRDAN